MDGQIQLASRLLNEAKENEAAAKRHLEECSQAVARCEQFLENTTRMVETGQTWRSITMRSNKD